MTTQKTEIDSTEVLGEIWSKINSNSPITWMEQEIVMSDLKNTLKNICNLDVLGVKSSPVNLSED